MDIKRFVALLYTLAESKGRTLTEGQIKTFYRFLAPYGEQQVTAAVTSAIRSADDWFSVGKLIRFIEGDPEEIATERWAAVVRLARTGVPTTEWPDNLYRAMASCGDLEEVTDKYRSPAMGKNFIALVRSEIVKENEERFQAALTADKRREIQ